MRFCHGGWTDHRTYIGSISNLIQFTDVTFSEKNVWSKSCKNWGSLVDARTQTREEHSAPTQKNLHVIVRSWPEPKVEEGSPPETQAMGSSMMDFCSHISLALCLPIPARCSS